MKKSVKLTSHGGLYLGFQISQDESAAHRSLPSKMNQAQCHTKPYTRVFAIGEYQAAIETQLQNTSR